MPITCDWDNEEKTIIRIYVHDPWDLSEYLQAAGHAQAMMRMVTHPIHIIYDLTNSFSVPRNLLSAIRTIENNHVPNGGLTICVRTSPYLRAVMWMGVRVFPHLGHNLFFTDTLQEAYDLIYKHNEGSSLR